MESKPLKKESFIENLSEITKGMKQKEIASIMGCTEGTMSKYLNPDKKDFPPVDKLYNLSQHFNVSIDWLIGVEKRKETGQNLSAKAICEMLISIYNSVPFDFVEIQKVRRLIKIIKVINSDKIEIQFHSGIVMTQRIDYYD